MTRKPTGAKAVAGLAIVLAAACSDECPLLGVKRTFRSIQECYVVRRIARAAKMRMHAPIKPVIK